MKVSEVKAKLNEDERVWWEIICAPKGIIETKEQYDYAILYGNSTSISTRSDDKLSSFETAKGCYLGIGNYFGGAAFYFYLDRNGEYNYEKNEYETVPFSYGKYGKIDFEEKLNANPKSNSNSN